MPRRFGFIQNPGKQRGGRAPSFGRFRLPSFGIRLGRFGNLSLRYIWPSVFFRPRGGASGPPRPPHPLHFAPGGVPSMIEACIANPFLCGVAGAARAGPVGKLGAGTLYAIIEAERLRKEKELRDQKQREARLERLKEDMRKSMDAWQLEYERKNRQAMTDLGDVEFGIPKPKPLIPRRPRRRPLKEPTPEPSRPRRRTLPTREPRVPVRPDQPGFPLDLPKVDWNPKRRVFQQPAPRTQTRPRPQPVPVADPVLAEQLPRVPQIPFPGVLVESPVKMTPIPSPPQPRQKPVPQPSPTPNPMTGVWPAFITVPGLWYAREPRPYPKQQTKPEFNFARLLDQPGSAGSDPRRLTSPKPGGVASPLAFASPEAQPETCAARKRKPRTRSTKCFTRKRVDCTTRKPLRGK